MTTKTPSAQSVSKRLRDAGFTPVPRHSREGVSTSRGAVPGTVYVSVVIDLPTKEQRFSNLVDEALAEMPYAVERISPTIWRVEAQSSPYPLDDLIAEHQAAGISTHRLEERRTAWLAAEGQD